MSEELKHIISWSGGKDSTATVILAHELGLRIDEIVFAEVMYCKKRNISGENPRHINFIKEIAIPKFESWGYKVTVLRGERDFLDWFFHVIRNSQKNANKLSGYMISGKCYLTIRAKSNVIKKYCERFENHVEYIGIAINEPQRLKRLKTNKHSLLAEHNMTEQDAYDLCKKHNLLSPIYKTQNRGGCWFCPNTRVREMAVFKQENPELYQEFVDLGKTPNLVTAKFNWTMTIDEFDKKVNEYIEINQKQQVLNFFGDMK